MENGEVFVDVYSIGGVGGLDCYPGSFLEAFSVYVFSSDFVV